MEATNPSNVVIHGYLAMFVFFTAALSAERIVRERQNHTIERLLASSVKRESILGGIFANTAAKGLIQILVFWMLGILVFKIDLELSPAAAIILSILVIIMSLAFGVMLATLVKTERSAGAIAVLASLCPCLRLSRTITLWPLSKSPSVMMLPTYPAPPVTRMFILRSFP